MIKVTVRAHLVSYDCFNHIYWTADLFTTKFNWMVCHKLEHLVLNNGLSFSRSRSQWRFKTSLNLYHMYLFCTTDLLAIKLDVLIYYHYWANQLQRSGHILTVALWHRVLLGRQQGVEEGGERWYILPGKATNLAHLWFNSSDGVYHESFGQTACEAIRTYNTN